MTDDQIEKMVVDIESKVGTVYAVYASKTVLLEALKELQWCRREEAKWRRRKTSKKSKEPI